MGVPLTAIGLRSFLPSPLMVDVLSIQVIQNSTLMTLIAVASTRHHHLRLASFRRSLLHPLPWRPRQQPPGREPSVSAASTGSRSVWPLTIRRYARRSGSIARVPWAWRLARTRSRRAGRYRPTDLYRCWHRTRPSQISLQTRSPTRCYSRPVSAAIQFENPDFVNF